MKYDLKQALFAYDFKTGKYLSDNFAQFSPAYVVTNEDVRDAVRVLAPEPGARILTVAGSGDQALFYKLSGASHVDTFDITFNAKMIMDIKTAAVQTMQYSDYLYMLHKIGVSRNVEDVSQYNLIKDKLPVDTREYIEQMRGVNLTRGASYLGACLHKGDYENLQKIIHEPFNFIWTDLTDLSSHLTQSYDQIYLSNILQYRAQPEYIVNVITGLVQHLSPNGKILVNVAPWFNGDELDAMKILQKKIAETGVGLVNFIKTHEHHMCVLRKR